MYYDEDGCPLVGAFWGIVFSAPVYAAIYCLICLIF